MPRVLLLTSTPVPAPVETAARVPHAFRARGWTVRQACIDTLALGPTGTVVGTVAAPEALADFDLVWVLGFGRQATFLDKMQLLAGVGAPARFVNSVEALLLLHAKYPVAGAGADFPQPETHAAADSARLVELAAAAGGTWVLKPPAGSFGRGVTVADAGSPRLAAAAEALCAGGRYALLQRYCPEVRDGEHRVLVAGGAVVGAYRREPGAEGGPANLAAGGRASPAAPDAARDGLARRAARALLRRGVRFAGLDVAGPWILEANVINPGGLATLAELGDADAPERLVGALLAGAGP